MDYEIVWCLRGPPATRVDDYVQPDQLVQHLICYTILKIGFPF